jgi:SAM-dependent methyltransferase
VHRQTIDAYDADAEHWLTTRYKARGEPLPAALRFRAKVGEGVIVDLGCGPGQLLPDLGEPTIGIDASTGMLSLAKGFGRAPLLQADMEVLPIRAGSVAGVFANFSLQHLPRPGFRVAAREARRILRPGGHLEVTMHSADSPYAAGRADGVREDDDMVVGRWFTYWTSADAVEVLEADGLRVVEVEEIGFANRILATRP